MDTRVLYDEESYDRIVAERDAARADVARLVAAAMFYAERCPNLYTLAEQDEEKQHRAVIREHEAAAGRVG